MRNPTTSLLAVAVAIFSTAAAHADKLYNDISIKITGTYSQAATGAPADTVAVTKPLKMADILALLGIAPGTALKIYWDDDATSFVLAPPGIIDGTDVVPTATIIAFSADYITLNKTAKKSFEAGYATLFNGALNAGYTTTYSYTTRNGTALNTVSGFGAINGKDTIIKMTLKDVYSIVL